MKQHKKLIHIVLLLAIICAFEGFKTDSVLYKFSKDSIGMEGGNQSSLIDIPIVAISPEGIFKYILIQGRVSQNGKETSVNFIRGDKNQEYHADNFKQFANEVKSKGFQIKGKNINGGKFEAIKGKTRIVFQCPGGGRIEHKYNGNKCFIYGYSQSYGRVDHTIAQKTISVALNYPLNQIKTSQEGY